MAGRVLRRAEDAARTLAGAAITAHLLDAAQASATLASCLDPGCPPGLDAQAMPDQPVISPDLADAIDYDDLARDPADEAPPARRRARQRKEY